MLPECLKSYTDVLSICEESIKEQMTHSKSYFDNCKDINDKTEMLNRLIALDHELYFITMGKFGKIPETILLNDYTKTLSLSDID